jgi:UDP-2,4-diacetamido-2,4,6-trideoxy-beta-L-altropyranose hydrolase
MKIAFRVDSSTQMGTGHTMRCVALALALMNQGKNLKKGTPVSTKNIHFLFRSQVGTLAEWIEQCGFTVKQLDVQNEAEEIVYLEAFLKAEKQAFDWLVVDHYELGFDWEKKLQPLVKNILALDDQPNRKHAASYLLDQNWVKLSEGEQAYQPYIPNNSTLWLGPRYALLRREFALNHMKARDYRMATQGKAAERVLVFFGGTDPTGETIPMLHLLQELISEKHIPQVHIDVVTGIANPAQDSIAALCEKHTNLSFHCQVENMAELMLKADWAIGAGGVSTWERLCLGLPAFVLAVADNQVLLSKTAAETAKAQVFLGLSERYKGQNKGCATATPELIKESIIHHFNNVEFRFKMSLTGLSLVDGMGAARIADLMEKAHEPRRRL